MFFFLGAQVLLFLYLLCRLVLPMRCGVTAKMFCAALLLLVSQHFLIRWAFDALSSPPIPAPVIMLEGWGFGTLICLALLCLARDIWLIARRLTTRRKTASAAAPAMSPGRRAALLTLASAVPAACAVRNAVILPEIRPMDAAFAALPRELEGLRIAQITDLHASDLLGPEWVAGVVARVNAAKPDLVLLTGDLVDGSLERRAPAVTPLADLRGRLGVFGCPGNHEYYAGYTTWIAAFERLGIAMLQNDCVDLRINGKTLAIAGLTDSVASGFGLPGPDRAGAFRNVPEDAFRILLEHRPASAGDNIATGAHLQLSGHTHGGHFPGFNTVVGRFNSGYSYGWYPVGGMRLYVSSGAGLWNGFPIRLRVPSEIPLITLRTA